MYFIHTIKYTICFEFFINKRAKKSHLVRKLLGIKQADFKIILFNHINFFNAILFEDLWIL